VLAGDNAAKPPLASAVGFMEGSRGVVNHRMLADALVT